MAFVDVYALAGSATAAYGEIDCVDDLSLPTLQALLPPGVAWNRDTGSNMTELARALSYEFSRIRQRAKDLIEETDPRTVFEMLSDYERVYGLSGTGTLNDRRVALHGKMLGFVSPSIPNLTTLAAGLGYTISIHEYKYTDIFTCKSKCNASLRARPWLFLWTVTTPSGSSNAALTAVLQAIAPLHTVLLMNFT